MPFFQPVPVRKNRAGILMNKYEAQ